ncbi:MAG: 50S ribosomal protein L21 [Patescibacteria group bacterium]|jgi:large subunit ribosomal protein L21
MKYAIIATGGKQYKVHEGQVLTCEKLDKKKGASVSFDKVLLFSDGKKVELGKPYLKGVKATGKVTEEGKAKKVLVVKFKSKVRYRRKRGHRQQFTKVKIEKIG